MKRLDRISSIFVLTVSLFFLNAIILGDRAHGAAHLMEALAIVRFDPKIEAQNFVLPDLNGNRVSLEEHRGKFVFLNFWATWCPPCRSEMPSMEKLYNKFKDNGFIIIAVNVGENISQVRAFKESYELNFPILLDADSSVGKIYGAISIPTTYLIDRDGYIIGGALGPRDWATDAAAELINSLLIISPKS